MFFDNEEGAILFDNGCSTTKIGLAGADLPSAEYATAISQITDGILPEQIGYVAGSHIRYAMERGVITRWDDMERIWEHGFTNIMKRDPMSQSVMLTEPPLNPRQNREKMHEIMFEKFGVDKLYIGNQGILSMYAAARTCGLIAACGEGVSYTVPVYEGHAIHEAIHRQEFAGIDVTNQMMKILAEERGIVLSSTADREKARSIKEGTCYVYNGFETEKEMTLPDGHKITLVSEAHRCPEILFSPPEPGLMGFHQMIARSIAESPIDIRSDFCANIILVGGTTLMPRFADRIKTELQSCIRNLPANRPKIVAPDERKYCVWIGGSILISLSTANRLWLRKSDYAEQGPSVVTKFSKGSIQ
eukprot:TRINITY_DN4888_c1_g1_i1.p1 TRINITY_DN4888_c1_g1~~TRINITY_DN4888_c1_g1_i1.p1  ORF type:complete len:360 (-),score=49.91 TRINITY_DN4888_c1_g1_i1:20-1099(-)